MQGEIEDIQSKKSASLENRRRSIVCHETKQVQMQIEIDELKKEIRAGVVAASSDADTVQQFVSPQPCSTASEFSELYLDMEPRID